MRASGWLGREVAAADGEEEVGEGVRSRGAHIGDQQRGQGTELQGEKLGPQK